MTDKDTQILEEILKKISTIVQQIVILDKNIKTIANSIKSSNITDKTPVVVLPEKVAPAVNKIAPADKNISGFRHFKFESADASKNNTGEVLAQKQRPSTNNNIVVKGKMMTNNDGKVIPLPGVSVKIYDDKDALVKETKTNRGGEWRVFLPPGKYVSLFEGKLDGQE